MSTRMRGARKPRDTYFDLVKLFPLLPIGSERDLDRAIALVDSLLDRDDLDPDEQGYLDVLSDLVERYEEEHHPIAPASDSAMLAYLIEQRETTQSAVARATGIAVSTINEVVWGKRTLRREHIARLARHFSVSPAVFAFEVEREK